MEMTMEAEEQQIKIPAYIPEEVFELNILNREYHERLLADIDRVAERAGVPIQFVWSKLSAYCTDDDAAWVRSMRQGHDAGLAYTGKVSKKPVPDRMMAITGVCLRNYMDARFMTVQQVTQALKAGTMPNPTVLLIPNFCMGQQGVDDIPQWEVSALLGILYSRLAKNLKTVLYIGSMAALEKNYGVAFKQHIQAHYTVI